jgi:2-keto-4-pentenoate hydratase
MDSLDSERSVARAFVAARQDARALPAYPGEPPQTLDTAYAIQALAVAEWPDTVCGWKVGRIPGDQVASLGAERLAGPIFAGQVVTATGEDAADMPVFDGGFAAVEAEFVAVLGKAPPSGQRHFTHEEAADLIERLHYGIEIASSPLASINADGSAVTISDFGNNAGLLIGPEIADWRTSGYETWPVAVVVDGVLAGSGTGAAMLDGPVGAVRFLLETAAERDLPLTAGMFVSTGAVSGVHEAAVGAHAVATFDDTVRLSCRLVAARPG